MPLRRLLVLCILFVALWGCKEHLLGISIKYNKIHGLEVGSRLIFEQNHVGDVTKIFYSQDGHYIVDAIIREAFTNAATDHAEFVITDDHQNKGKKAIEIIQTRKGGNLLKDGATVEGTSKTSALLTKTGESLEKKFEDIEKGFMGLFDELKSIPESAEFQSLQRELEQLAKEMKQSGRSVREKVEKELLPKLKQEIKKLRERLQKFGREEEATELENQLEKMMQI